MQNEEKVTPVLIKILRYWEAKGKAREVSDHGRGGGTFIGRFFYSLAIRRLRQS